MKTTSFGVQRVPATGRQIANLTRVPAEIHPIVRWSASKTRYHGRLAVWVLEVRSCFDVVEMSRSKSAVGG